MAERTHEGDELKDTDNSAEPADTTDADDATPADTEGKEPEAEPKKDDADEVKAKHKAAWLSKIKEGKATTEDMPENLGWLKKEIKEELEPKPVAPKESEVSAEVRKALQAERAEEEFNFLVADIQNSEISAEQDAQLQDKYEGLILEFQNPTALQKLKVLNIAREAVGIKDTSETIKARRRQGMSLPPMGGKKRSTVNKDKETEMEKRLGGDLPPGY